MNLAEILAKAAMNTILGMGVVFSVLIFISFIISLFKYLPGLIDQFHQRKTATVEAEADETEFVPQIAQETDSSLTVAIITAAIQATLQEKNPVGDAYIVRSIRRVQ